MVCISGRCGDGGFNVVTSQLPVREKVRPARPGVGVSAKKFALRTKNGPKMAVYGVPGELFRGTVAERSVLGKFCRVTTQVRPLLGGRHLRSNREPTH